MAEDEAFVRTWMRVVRRIRLGRTVKAVATMLVTYADPDGSRVHPGIARLSHECELSYTSVKNALRTLRKYGLIVKVGKKGDADDYHLILHEDLIERVDVPTPSQADKEIHRIRMAWKGTYSPGLRSTRTPADEGEEEDLRSTAPTAESLLNDRSAVNGSTPETGSAVNGSNSLRSTAPTATYQDVPPTKTDHSEEDLRTDVAVLGPRGPEEDQISPPVVLADHRCPHGNSTRLNRQHQPRCPECRAAQQEPPPPDECSHGVKSRYRCPACARGLLEVSHDQQI